MAGAVDLSALKQQTAPAGEGDGGAAQPNGLEITEANLEAEVLVQSQPDSRRRAAVVAPQ